MPETSDTDTTKIDTNSPLFWRLTLAVCLGSFLVFANLYISHPLMPLLKAEFALGELEASWSLAISLLTLGLSLLVYAPLSDALGRRRIMFWTLLGGILTSLLIPLAQTYNQVLVLRALQGFLLGGLPALGIAYLGDHLRKPALLAAVGYYISANSLGGVSGRVVSGWIAEHGSWQLSFTVIAVASSIGMLVLYWLLPKTESFQPRPLRFKQAMITLGTPMKKPVLVMAYLIGGGNFLVFSNQYSYITYRLHEAPFGLPTSMLGLLFLTYLSGSAGAALSGKLSRHFTVASGMLLGILIMACGLLITLSDSLSWIISGLLVCSFGFFLCHTMASSWVSHNAGDTKASASSLYLVAYYLGASVGSFYLDPLWQHWQWSGVIAGALAMLTITGIAAAWLKHCESQPVKDESATARPAVDCRE